MTLPRQSLDPCVRCYVYANYVHHFWKRESRASGQIRQALAGYYQMFAPMPRHPSPGLGGCSDSLRRLVLCLRLDAWAESSLLRFLHTCCLMRQLLGSRMRAQTPSALWLCPSRGAGGLCTQHPASKESKAGPHMLLHQWVPPIPYCPPRPTLPLICPVGQEAQVWAGQPPHSGSSNRAGADGQ